MVTLSFIGFNGLHATLLAQVATLWWVFNGRILWDKVNTLASEVVEEYKNARLVYIKGTPKPMISSRDFVFVSHK